MSFNYKDLEKAVSWLVQPGIQALEYGISDKTTKEAVDMILAYTVQKMESDNIDTRSLVRKAMGVFE